MLKNLLHRPIAVTMMLIAIVTLGVLALGRIPVSLMPDIDVPRMTVQMSSPGSSAQEVEQRLVTPMRQQLSGVAGLKSIETLSKMDGGIITLGFEPGSNMSLLFIEVNEKIDRAMNAMPKDMERPKVMKMGALDLPAFYVDITAADAGGQPHRRIPLHEMSRLVRNVVSKRMEQLPEVAMVDMSGTVGTQIAVLPDETKLNALGLTNADIERAINDNNIVLEALSVRDGIYRYTIHFDAQLLSVADIGNIYLRHAGRLIQLKEVCRVEEVAAPRNGMVRLGGRDAVTLAVIKQSDAQMADLQRSIAALTEDLKADYPELCFEVTRDQTQLLTYSVRNLEWNLVAGAVMASLVLFLFIGGWRLPLLVIVSIPLSLILTLLCFYLLGISLNVISLSGLILGVGMIVDNAIIVIDNIRQRGDTQDQTVVDATREVFMPMLSSVLTTCSVFIPLIFLSGTAGALFYDQAMGVTIALFASLLVAALVVPVYYYALCRHRPLREAAFTGRLSGWLSGWLMVWYERGMNLALRRAGWVLAGFAGCVVLVALLFPFVRKERMPRIAHDDALMYIDWNLGIATEENNRRVEQLLDEVRPSLVAATVMVGHQDFMLPHTRDLTGSEAVCYLKTSSAQSLDSVVRAATRYLAKHAPEAKVEFGIAANVFDLIFSTDQPDLEVRVQREEGGRPSVAEMRQLTDSLRAHFPELDIQPVATEDELRYEAAPERMAYYKVTYQQLYSRLKELLSSSCIYEISSGGERVPVIVGVDSRDAATLLGQTLRNADGVDVPLSYLVAEHHGEDFKRLSAGGAGEYAPIRIEHATDGQMEAVMAYTKQLTAQARPRHGENAQARLKAAFTGNYFESRSLIGELAVTLLVAVLLLYFILAAQFESLVQPAMILTEIVIDVCVVMLALWLLDESLNLMSMIGLVVMSGIIINDSILKVDTINQLRRAGMPLLRAIVTAGHRRLKPIVMTSLTTMLAIVPFLQRGDMGSALQFPLSLTLIVGMAVGTLVSLFFVPLVYYVIYGCAVKRFCGFTVMRLGR